MISDTSTASGKRRRKTGWTKQFGQGPRNRVGVRNRHSASIFAYFWGGKQCAKGARRTAAAIDTLKSSVTNFLIFRCDLS